MLQTLSADCVGWVDWRAGSWATCERVEPGGSTDASVKVEGIDGGASPVVDSAA